jgi:outer membrane protein assembly factor BamD (BamD/ComL family)
VKWVFISCVCLFCTTTWVRGDAAADLYNQGIGYLTNQQYADAAKTFDSIINDYPTYPDIDEVHIRAGLANLYAEKFPEAVDRLSGLAKNEKSELRPTALYFTALAQFSQGQKSSDKSNASTAFNQAIDTLTTLINLATTAPTPDSQGYYETAIYYRALSNYELENYPASEKDLLQLTESPQFKSSLSRPDYFLRLGSVYAVETNEAVTAKKPIDDVELLANKALAAFDQVSNDPNALVQANDANMSKAEVDYLIAQLDTESTNGYKKALDAFRLVRRKDDMIPLQQQRLDQMRAQAADEAQKNAANPIKTLGSNFSLVISREENRLKDLQDGPDPIIQALIRMAECYVNIAAPDGKKESDEARTILHRVAAHAKLTDDQQKEVDFQTLYSYVLGGQTDEANKALDAYLSKHAGDPNADFISFQIAGKLMERADFNGALAQAQRSLKDFPKGRYAAEAVGLEAQALTRLNRISESDAIVDKFLADNSTDPKANNLLLTRAQNKSSRGDLNGALDDFKKVRDNTAATTSLRAVADIGYIQTLQALKRYDDVIAEAKTFAAQNPDHASLPTVMLFSAMALSEKHDPGAITALQDLAKKYPQDPVAAPYALFTVVTIYSQQKNVPAMIQAASDLRTACPTAYPQLVAAADLVSTALLDQKKYTDAIALYQPLIDAPKPDIAATANNKIGDIWLAAASKGLGHYQSMNLDTRAEAEKRLANSEQSYLTTLKKYPDQLGAVADAFDGLVNLARQRRSWGLLKDADLEGYLTKLGADLTTLEMQARLELAKAGLVFVTKNGANDFPAALDRFKQVVSDNSGLTLTRQETNQFGQLLLAAKDYTGALKLYTNFLNAAAPTDQVALGDAYYGIGATYLAQGDIAKAKEQFLKIKALPQGGAWHPRILDINYGIALADEQSSDSADIEEARSTYAQLMQTPPGPSALPAKAMLGYGRLLEKSGNAVKPTTAGPNEYAIHYYQEPHTIYGPAAAAQSAEGLFDAGQAYEKVGDKTNAKKQYDDLLKTYATLAPDWAAKATDAESKLGQ